MTLPFSIALRPLLIALAILTACEPILAKNITPDAPNKEWTILQLSSEARGFLSGLPGRNTIRYEVYATEQLLDWTFLAILNQQKLSESELVDAMYGHSPARNDYLLPVSNFAFGESRGIQLPKRKLLALVTMDSALQHQQLCYLADAYRMTMGAPPSEVVIYEYEVDPSGPEARFRPAGIQPGAAFFKEQAGYVEREVKDEASLLAFLEEVSDLTYAHPRRTELTLGGRTFKNSRTAGVNIEHVACLYQSYRVGGRAPGFSLEPKFQHELIARKLRKALSPSERFYRELLDEDGFEIGNIIVLNKALQDKYELLEAAAEELENNNMNAYRELQRYLSGVFLPFHIDSVLFEQLHIQDDVWDMLLEAGYVEGGDTLSSPECLNGVLFEQGLKQFKEERGLPEPGLIDEDTWYYLSQLSRKKRHEFQVLKVFLQKAESKANYIYAKYYGGLKGTEVGMTLFYTDLGMKMFASDVAGLKRSGEIEGFIPMGSLSASPVYARFMSQYPARRYWLSASESGFDIHPDHALYFSANATQINAKSRIDLFDDESEARPDPRTAEFVNWWNSHYDRVADYEPQYHKLDQIMKWSTVISWVAARNLPLLSFLNEVDVRRDYDFEAWYTSNDSLKIRVEIPFLDREALGEATECLAMSDAKKYYGGVTLPPRQSVQSKLSPSKQVSQRSRPGKNYSNNTKGTEQIQEKIFEIGQNNIEASNPSLDAFQGMEWEFSPFTRHTVISVEEEKLVVDLAYGEKKVGRLTISKEGKVDLEQAEFKPILDISRTIVNSGNPISELAASSKADNIVKIPIYDSYLFKMKDINEWVLNTLDANWLTTPSVLHFRGGALFSSRVRSTALIKGEEDINNLLSKYKNCKVQEEPEHLKLITEFTTEPPPLKKDTKLWENDRLWLSLEGQAGELEMVRGVGELHIDIPSFTTVELQKIQSIRMEAIKLLQKYPKNAKVTYLNRDGQAVAAGRKSISGQQPFDLCKELLSPGSAIRGIVLNPKAKGLRLLRGNIMEAPTNMGIKEKALFREVNRQLEESSGLAAFYVQIERINKQDIHILGQISDEFPELRQDYIAIRQLNTGKLNKGEAVVSLRTAGPNPKYLYCTEQGEIGVGQIELGKDIDFAGQQKAFEEAGTLSALRQLTISEFELLQSIQKETGAQNFITLEHENTRLSAAKIWTMHDGSSQVSWIIDQPDINQSIQNYRKDVVPQPERSVILSSYRLEDTIYASLEYHGMDSIRAPAWTEFVSILQEDKYQQIYLVVSCEENEIVFEDRNVSFELLTSTFEGIPGSKELLYVISNEAPGIQYLAARSNKFQRIISSSFRTANDGTVTKSSALHNLGNFFRKVVDNLSGSKKTSVDELIRELHRDGFDEIKSSRRMRGARTKPPMDVIKGIPDLKVEAEGDVSIKNRA